MGRGRNGIKRGDRGADNGRVIGRCGPAARAVHHRLGGSAVQTNNLVVARYLDGRTAKGSTHDFSATRPTVHVELAGSKGVVDIRLRDLKALFFVKTLEGFPDRPDVAGFVKGPAETAQGRKVAVLFQDGELLCGYTLGWSPERPGFFVFPSDKGTNNERVFVVARNVKQIEAGPKADALAEKVLASRPGGDARRRGAA